MTTQATLAQCLRVALMNVSELALSSQVMRPKPLQILCVIGMVIALVGLLCVVPIWGRMQDGVGSALVDGLTRRVERVEERQQLSSLDLVGLHGELLALRQQYQVLDDQLKMGMRIVERTFWGIVAILGSILYRGIAAFWSLRRGWLMPPTAGRRGDG